MNLKPLANMTMTMNEYGIENGSNVNIRCSNRYKRMAKFKFIQNAVRSGMGYD